MRDSQRGENETMYKTRGGGRCRSDNVDKAGLKETQKGKNDHTQRRKEKTKKKEKG